MTKDRDSLERQWARLGVLFNCRPSRATPDLERLLLETARRCSENARLLPLVVTWLVRYGYFVARHRLKRLAVEELEAEGRAVLGLLIEGAVAEGATRDLLIVSEVCAPLARPVVLSAVQRGNEALERVARKHASELSRRWGVLTPEIELKEDAVRPVEWLLARNPEYRERIVRKGDLRVSIMVALRHDAGGTAKSESALARLSGATRVGVRKALGALVLEGVVEVRERSANGRDTVVTLEVVD